MRKSRSTTSHTYDGSVYDRRTTVEDQRQRQHLARSRWLSPGDCTCRTTDSGDAWYICVNANCSNPASACGGYCPECFNVVDDNVDVINSTPQLDIYHLVHQRKWSDKTFGPGRRQAAVIDHITKELQEVLDSNGSLDEWVDVIILALDGATRAAVDDGGTVADVLHAVVDKQARNEARTWPDWRSQPSDKAIEHIRAKEVGV